MKIGFIGTGLMGLPMAKNLLKSGFKLKVYNRSISKAEPLKEFGAEISKTLSEVVKDNDFVITMLTDDSAVDAIMNNSDLLEEKLESKLFLHVKCDKRYIQMLIHQNY